MKWTKAFVNAWNGIKYCYRTQLNFKIHFVFILLVAIAGFVFYLTTTEWILILICCVSVLVTEMLNTAIEKLCDLVTLEHHPLVKIIKDVSAGAVFTSAIGSALIGSVIFLPKVVIQIKLLLQ